MAYQIGAGCNGCGYCVQWCPSKAIQGRRKQPHKIIAERCIECGACGRICGQRAVMDAAGHLQQRIRLAEWPKPRWDYARCDGCAVCVDACPTHSISIGNRGLAEDEGDILMPFLAKSSGCISCGFCRRDCPREAIDMLAAV
jgi:Pyruvate/2-oxoacid:ferredoxin oxidoreductase delta subunit